MCCTRNIFCQPAFIIIYLPDHGEEWRCNALTRSSNLVRSQWWNTFLVNIVGLIIVYAANWLITIIFNAFGLNIDIFGKENRMNEYPDWFLYVTGIKIVLASLFYLIPYTFLAFQYFSLDEQSQISRPVSR